MRIPRSHASIRVRSANGMLVAAAALLCGCSHSLVYDETRDKQSQAAVKAVEEAHLTSTVEGMSKAFADMAEREEASARERAEQLFAWEMIRVSRARSLDAEFKDDNNDVDGLATTIEARQKKLGLKGDSDETLTKLREGQVLMRKDTERLANHRITFHGSFGDLFADCGAIYAASADPGNKSDQLSPTFLPSLDSQRRPSAALQFKELVDDCKSLDQLVSDRNALFTGGIVSNLFAEIDKKTKERAAYAAARSSAAADLAAAKKAAEPVIKAATPGKPKLAEVEKVANKLLDIVARASAVNELAGSEVLAKEKLERLESLLGAIAGASADGKVQLTEDQLVTVELVRTLPSLKYEAHKLLAEAAKPRLVPFLAAIEYQKLVLEKLDALNKIEEKEMDALRHQLQAAIDEAAALAQIQQPIKKHGWSNKSIVQLDQQLQGVPKRTLYAMLATYGDEVRQKRIDAAVWRSRVLAARHERNLVSSKYAARQWDALMDMTAKVLADYHAAGIKPTDLTEFFKALGLVSIGVGVAQ